MLKKLFQSFRSPLRRAQHPRSTPEVLGNNQHSLHRSGISRNAVLVVDRLQKAGFVERRADPNDRRVWRLYLLPQSEQVTGPVEEVAHALRKEATAGISAADLATALAVLDRVRENLLQLDREGRGEPSPKS